MYVFQTENRPLHCFLDDFNGCHGHDVGKSFILETQTVAADKHIQSRFLQLNTAEMLTAAVHCPDVS